MLILRIRQAEVAAHAGRLDEAFDLVTRDGRFRSHRRGQEAITRIIASLVRRGREHLSAGRLIQAATDCERAGKLGGGDLPDVAQLALDLRAAHHELQREQRDAALAVAAAKRHVEDGALSVGRRILATVEDSRAKRLMTDIDDHRARLEAALASAGAALDRGDLATAAEAVARGRGVSPGDPRVGELSAKAARVLAERATEELRAGRLDRAGETADILRTADPDSSLARDVGRAIEYCGSAWARLNEGRPHDAVELLRRVEVLFPKTSWIGDAVKQLNTANEALGQLRAGPLALVSEGASSAKGEATADVRGVPPAAPLQRGGIGAPAPPASQALPDRFILQVDGGGAFLVVRSAVAKVGPISSSALPDVALVADATAPAVSIERVEDDYFLRSGAPVSVNDKGATNALLATGDRIGLSPRCRFTFALPHPASTTAVLDLVAARYPRSDVRRVILMDRDLIIGGSAASHVRVSGISTPIVLNLRGGMLRPSVEATLNGKPLGRDEGLPVGVPVVAGGVSFVISRV